MDLTGQSKINILWANDEDAGTTTLTFKDATETNVLGTLVIESTRLRSVLQSLGEVTKFYFPDGSPQEKGRTLFLSSSGKATVAFS